MSRHKTSSLSHFLFLLLVAVALMMIDHRSQWFVSVRALVSSAKLPLYQVINMPSNVLAWIDANYPDASLHQKYSQLQEKQILLASKLQRYEAVVAENRRLNELLAVAQKTEKQALVAQIVKIGLAQYPHYISINRGLESGVYLGQMLISTAGVLGQVSQLGVNHSTVTLLTNANHNIPVQVQRNGMLAIVRGIGEWQRVVLPFLPENADIKVGDILVTSGFGGRFPPGYKVAEVVEIVADASQALLSVYAKPFAQHNMSGEVLLLWNDEPAVVDVQPTVADQEQ